jgi:predicted HicB family RNase H-like nuclease
MEKRFTFRLDTAAAKAVRCAAKQEGRTVANWIRSVIAAALKRKGVQS